MTARERILDRVRAAVDGRERVPHPGPLTAGDPVAGGTRGTAAPRTGAVADAPHSVAPAVSRFMEAFHANGGEVVRFPSTAAAREWLDAFVRNFDGAATGAGVAADLAPLRPAHPPESAPLGVSLAIGAAAETGTLLLDSAAGRRHQLLPPVHLVWIREPDIDRTLGEALARLRLARGDALPAALALHSAPSKSADIGRVLVVGVHGPGRVIAALIGNGERP